MHEIIKIDPIQVCINQTVVTLTGIPNLSSIACQFFFNNNTST